MDPLNDGDNGALGTVFDTITGTVNSIENFGQTVGEVTSFKMGEAMIWSVIAFVFLNLFFRVVRPWNEGAADRWRNTGRVRATPAAPFQDPKDQKIADLEDRIAEMAAQIAALTGSMTQNTETADVN